MTLADAIARFLHACRLRKLSGHTQRVCACDLGFFGCRCALLTAAGGRATCAA